MRKLLSLVLVSLCLQGQNAVGGKYSRGGSGSFGGGSATPATYTCGATVTSGAVFFGSTSLALGTPCTTGSDTNGYSVTSVNVYSGTAGGKIYAAIFTDTTSGCNGAAPHCINTVVCSDSSGVTAVASGFTAITLSGCGTLAANTSYWIVQEMDNASRQAADQASTNCPAPLAFTSATQYVSGVTPGVWPGPIAPVDISTSPDCYIQYMVLQPL